MNKKMKKMKKDVKRNLRDIGYKKACKSLKQAFYKEFKTSIYDRSYQLQGFNFHPEWDGKKHPLIKNLEIDGHIMENSGTYLPLDVSKATEYIIWCRKYTKVLVSCFNFKNKERNLSCFTV